MEIEIQRKGAVAILKPKGPLSRDDAEGLKAKLLESVGNQWGRVVLDASAVLYADSRGVEVLVEVSEALSQNGQVLKLCHANETIREILYLTGFTPLFEYYEDVNAAVRSFL